MTWWIMLQSNPSRDPRSDTLFWHSFLHLIWKYIWQAITNILSGIYSDILSDILDGILSDHLAGDRRAPFPPELTMSFWHLRWSPGPSIWKEDERRKRRRRWRKKKEGAAHFLKSRDPHLAEKLSLKPATSTAMNWQKCEVLAVIPWKVKRLPQGELIKIWKTGCVL